MPRVRTLSLFFISIVALTLFSSMAMPLVAHAQEYEYQENWVIIPPECRGSNSEKQCDLNSFVQLFVNLAIVGMKVLPYLSMIMMIWAGFNLIQSGGNPEKIQGGKKMISSIVIGVLIVTILAWTWSYFIVFLLTGNQKLFPNTPFSRDWWGGGTIEDRPPSVGCCVVTDALSTAGVGCVENLKTECIGLPVAIKTEYNVDIQTFFQGEQQYCDDVTQCQNYQQGCCVPRDATDKTCYYPATGSYESGEGGTGCLQWPKTLNNPNNCNTLTRCETIGNQAQP